MKQVEPPSIVPSSRPLHFLIGKDSRGNWVVQDERGLCGGLFVDRTQALRFAMFENGNKPQAVVMVRSPDCTRGWQWFCSLTRQPNPRYRSTVLRTQPRDIATRDIRCVS